MRQTINELFARKSVRAFEKKEIPAEMKRQILLSAAAAPTAGNQQLYTILDITDPALKARLAETCDHQPFIAEAPMVLIFCADCRKWYDAYTEAGCEPRRPGAGDLLLAVSDANIAAQNAVTAAWSLGIGSCYIGDVTEHYEIHRALLQLPRYVFPTAMIVFGWPTQQQKEREKPLRIDLKHIVHENGYRLMDHAELREMFAPKVGQRSYEDWIRAFCRRKYNSDFSREMTRSVKLYLKEFENDEEENTMPEMLEMIRKRRSCRCYKPDMVPQEKIDAVIEAGLWAASGMGRQSPVIIAVTDRETRDELSAANAAIMGGRTDPFYGAPVVLIVLADKGVGTCVYDGSLAIGNMLLEADALGLGACWIHRAKEEFEGEIGRKILEKAGLKGDYVGVGHVILGYPGCEAAAPVPRRDGRVFRIG